MCAVLIWGMLWIATARLTEEPHLRTDCLTPLHSGYTHLDTRLVVLSSGVKPSVNADRQSVKATVRVPQSVTVSAARFQLGDIATVEGDETLCQTLRQIELGASGKTDSSTQGNTARAGTLQTRITVQVVETFPNGVLRIEGKRTLKINEETQTLVFSGLVRIRDIRADNTVPSTAIANAEIYFEGKGIVGSRQREGILTRLFKIIF